MTRKFWVLVVFICGVLLIPRLGFAQLSDNNPVALVGDKKIYSADINPNRFVADKYRKELTADQYSAWEQDYKIQRLESLIYEVWQNQLLDEMKMQPTADEINVYINFFLSQPLTPEDQKREEKELQANPNYKELKKESFERTAPPMVKAWKFNKALYVKYGGRVIFQQAGYEPIDAYKQFLEEHQKNKSYEILDPAYKNIFSKMNDYFAMPHQYMKKEDADQYFEKSWWDPTFQKM
jgi:hypothetical protein